jgi:hypothetical protein
MQCRGDPEKQSRLARWVEKFLTVVISQGPRAMKCTEKRSRNGRRNYASSCAAAVLSRWRLTNRPKPHGSRYDLERLTSAATSQFNSPPASSQHSAQTGTDIPSEDYLIREVAQLGYEVVKEGTSTVAQKGLFRRYLYSREDLLLLVEQAKGHGEHATQ